MRLASEENQLATLPGIESAHALPTIQGRLIRWLDDLTAALP